MCRGEFAEKPCSWLWGGEVACGGSPSAPGPVLEEFPFPRRGSPPSARTFPGAREVMINSGLALSPPEYPLGPHPPWLPASDSTGRGVPAALQLLSTAAGDPSARQPPLLPTANPGTPAACARARTTASPRSKLSLKTRPLQKVSLPFVFCFWVFFFPF